MNNQTNTSTNALAETATAAIAATTKSPFMTAFKITIGIGLAHVALGLLFMSGCATIGTVAYLVVK